MHVNGALIAELEAREETGLEIELTRYALRVDART